MPMVMREGKAWGLMIRSGRMPVLQQYGMSTSGQLWAGGRAARQCSESEHRGRTVRQCSESEHRGRTVRQSRLGE
eukprot:1154081-Pelagomonas_calceolata.AAC.16